MHIPPFYASKINSNVLGMFSVLQNVPVIILLVVKWVTIMLAFPT
jgi:hypothetical protein